MNASNDRVKIRKKVSNWVAVLALVCTIAIGFGLSSVNETATPFATNQTEVNIVKARHDLLAPRGTTRVAAQLLHREKELDHEKLLTDSDPTVENNGSQQDDLVNQAQVDKVRNFAAARQLTIPEHLLNDPNWVRQAIESYGEQQKPPVAAPRQEPVENPYEKLLSDHVAANQ